MAFVSNLAIAFQLTAQKFSGRTALLYPASGEKFSYGELLRLTDHLAEILQEGGLKTGSVVAMFSDKSPASYASMLACLRLGVTYTMLDPESPWQRIQKILGTCAPNMIINAFATMPHAAEIQALSGCKLLDLQAPRSSAAPLNAPDIHAISGSTPAYIMFTSGSTGTPKGAVMSHANLLWFIQWSRSRFKITENDVLTNVNPIYFDNSVFDFYSAIFNGATLVPFQPSEVKDPRALVKSVDRAGCTIWFSVPSLLVYLLTTRAISSSDFVNLRKIVFGGEGFPKPKLKQLFDLFGHRIELENVYGPTECTCICSAHTINQSDFEDMQNLATLGHISQNFSFEILPQAPSNSRFGELLLLGPQVGLGYYNDLARTRSSFIQNPTHDRFLDVGYRTGDLVELDASGRLHFKGRVDYQIKHMGYRIELEEIEAALGTISGVKECAVIYHKTTDGFGQIIGYVAGEQLAPSEIIDDVAKIVPPYMVPRIVQIIDQLPKNANGKIDRAALKSLADRPVQR